MSFGRIKRHIKTKHLEITLENYLQKFYNTLPKDNGFILLRFWESDVNNNLDKIINEISKLWEHSKH